MVTAAVRLNSVSNLVWNLAAGGPRLPDGPGVRVALTLDGLLQDAQAALALVRERGAVVERADALHLVLPLVHVERHLHVARRRRVPLRACVQQKGLATRSLTVCSQGLTTVARLAVERKGDEWQGQGVEQK